MKRFTETDKWKDKWFRGLDPASKLLFMFLIDNCDNAGFIEKDFELWSFHTGIDQEAMEGAYKGLARGLIEASDWIWIKGFLRHQKHLPLNPDNRAHGQIIELLRSKAIMFKDVWGDVEELLGACKGLISPTGIGIGKGIGKGKGKDKGIVKGEIKKQAEELYSAYPRKEGRGDALKAIEKALTKQPFDYLLKRVKLFADLKTPWTPKDKLPHPATWFNQERWADDEDCWKSPGVENKHQFDPRKLAEQWGAL